MSVNLEPGREVSIAGQRGRFTVIKVDEEKGEVTVFGEVKKGRAPAWRTFRLDRVATVHRTIKRRKETL